MKKALERLNPRGDVFEVSKGNLLVLENIPKMMQDKKFRKELRKLTMRFVFENIYKGCMFKSTKDGTLKPISYEEFKR